MCEFENLANPALVPGIVLRTEGSDRFLRVTHVFGTAVYAMWVSTLGPLWAVSRGFPNPLGSHTA